MRKSRRRRVAIRRIVRAGRAGAAPGKSSADSERTPRRILSIDVGGTGVKFLLSGKRKVRRIESGKRFTPDDLVREVRAATPDWHYEAIALGLPGKVGETGLLVNPENLGDGWVGFDFGKAFGVPVRIINDAAMQALGSYRGGRMLFLGLGTGLGSTLVTGHTIVSLELGRLLLDRRKTLGERVGKRGLKRHGRRSWERILAGVIPALRDAVLADYVVLGGGNARKMKTLPKNVLRGDNDNAMHGGFRLWNVEGVPLHPGARRARKRSSLSELPWRSV